MGPTSVGVVSGGIQSSWWQSTTLRAQQLDLVGDEARERALHRLAIDVAAPDRGEQRQIRPQVAGFPPSGPSCPSTGSSPRASLMRYGESAAPPRGRRSPPFRCVATSGPSAPACIISMLRATRRARSWCK